MNFFVALLPHSEKLSPNHGNHSSDPEGASSVGVGDAISLQVLVLECDPVGGEPALEKLTPSDCVLAMDKFVERGGKIVGIQSVGVHPSVEAFDEYVNERLASVESVARVSER
jgi:hypothetical protein